MDPIATLSAALYGACLRDLPDIHYENIDFEAERKHLDALPEADRKGYYEARQKAGNRIAFAAENGFVVKRTRRPSADQCEVTMFMQAWASTALGYGGIGGAAITSAHTVIVECHHTGYAAVYFGGGRLAYLVSPEAQAADGYWQGCLARREMPSCAKASERGWVRA